MRQLRLYVPIFFALILSVAACCKAICLNDYIDVNYIGYSNLDIDTVLVRTFKGGTNYSQKLDSEYHRLQTPPADTIVAILKNIPAIYDYEVVILAHNRVYRLSDISTQTKSCGCNKQSFNEVVSYTLDGVNFQERIVRIRK